MSGIGAGLAGLRVRISFFHAREQISVGFRVMPTPVPAGTYLGHVRSEEFGWFGGMLEEFVREKHCYG